MKKLCCLLTNLLNAMKESVKDKVVGTWKLVSWTYVNEKNELIDYFGKDATGILMYDIAGNMNAQLMKAGRVSFASDSINSGTAEESKHAFHSYLAYFGKYYERAPGEIIHFVEGSLFPNWIGMEQLRYAVLTGNVLQVSTPPVPTQTGETVFTVTWERVV
jgi:hypothetical protein